MSNGVTAVSPAPVPVQSNAAHPTLDSVKTSLRSSGYASLRDLTVTQSQGRILLAGRVPSYYMKQLATFLATTAGTGHVIQSEIIVS